jgi:hypothetical protein
MMLSYSKEEYDTEKTFIQCQWKGETRGNPALNVDELDSLLHFIPAFQHDFELEFSECREYQSPASVLPAQVWEDIDSAFEYLQSLVFYKLAMNTLTLKTDLTIREVSYSVPLSLYDIKRIQTFPRGRYGKPRQPRLTRKRANGLWWILTVARLMEEQFECCPLPFSRIPETIESEKGFWDCAYSLIAGIARFHESRFPTATRQGGE